MKHDQPQFKLRLPKLLKDALEEQAAANDRTLTAEIVARLQASFSISSESPTLDALKRMEAHQEPWQLEVKKEYAKLSMQNQFMTLVARQNQANFTLMQTGALLAEVRRTPERKAELPLIEKMHADALAERDAVDLQRVAVLNEMHQLALTNEDLGPPAVKRHPKKQPC